MSSMFYEIFQNDDQVKNYFERLSKYDRPHTLGCFGDYSYYYKGDNTHGNLYFGFYVTPNVNKLVEEINENFKNIKVSIVVNREFELDENDTDEFFDEDYDEGSLYNYCVFKIDMDEKYNQASNFVLKLALAEFIRGFCPYLPIVGNTKNIKENFIDGCLYWQGTSYYSTWLDCDPSRNYKCSREIFNKFDDINLINNILSDGAYYESMPMIWRLIRVLEGQDIKKYWTDRY